MSKKEILIIGDTPGYLNDVEGLLANADLTLVGAAGAEEGLEKARSMRPAGIILDIQLEGTDGIELCRQLKASPDLYQSFVIFYTTESEEYIQIAGLNAGADDYIIKPCRSRIMISRIKALLKRKRGEQDHQTTEQITNGDILIDREKYTVVKSEERIIFPRKEFELLFLLLSKPGKVYSRRELSNLIWGEEKEVKGRTIDVHIRKIREKLGPGSIRTIKGIGYKWSESSTVDV